MNTWARIAAEENANLAAKIIETHEKAKKELSPYLKTYLCSRPEGLSENDKLIIDNENLVDVKINQASPEESFALTINARSSQPQDVKVKKIIDFIGDAIKSTLSNMSMVKFLIKDENYAGALESLVKVNKAIGVLEVAIKLDLFDKLIKEEKKNKRAAADARHNFPLKLKAIVLQTIKSEEFVNKSSSVIELLTASASACRQAIINTLGNEKYPWKMENFPNSFMQALNNDIPLKKEIELLIKDK